MPIVFQPQSLATGAPPTNPEEFRAWALKTIAALQRDMGDLEQVIRELAAAIRELAAAVTP